MHISLDSELGRQRRLNQIGETISSIAAPTAAYSLRSLTGGDPRVVRVRRESDNDEQDFTASEVASGAMLDYVNTQAIKPLDIKALTSGGTDDGRNGDFLIAKAAYSLRSLGTRQATIPNDAAPLNEDTVVPASGKYVCQVRSVTGDIKSFTADEVSDGTLVDFVLGNTKSLLSSRAYFDGSNDNVGLTSEINLASDFSLEYTFVVTETEQQIIGKNASGSYLRAQGTGEITAFRIQTNSGAESINLTSNLKYGEANTVKLKRVLRNFGIYDENDVLISEEFFNSDTFTISSFGKARGTFAKGVIYNIRIDTNGDGTIDHSYNGYGNTLSDWQDLVGGNNAVAVNGSPALFTGQDQDGFVRTWYDQSVTGQDSPSANNNHATQSTAASQPKIVDAGSLLTAGVTFDGGDSLSVSGDPVITASSSGVFSAFSVQTVATSEAGYLFGNTSTSNGASFYAAVNQFTLTNKVNVGDDISRSSGQNLLSAVYNNGDAGLLVNGAGTMNDVGTYDFSAGTGDFVIGNRNSGSADATFLIGSINEIIVYNSDQTDNRTAIEANIGEHYSISGIPAFDNSVSGFVETWYDQSGNGNNLTQATASKQPTIVTSGAINTRNSEPIIKFIQANSTHLEGASSVVPTGTDFALTCFQALHIDASSGGRLGIFSSSGSGSNPGTSKYGFGNASSRKVTVRIQDASDTVTALESSALSNDTDSILTYMVKLNDGSLELQTFNLGAQLGSTLTASVTDQSYNFTANTRLGARSGSDNFSDSEFFEVLFYATDQLTNRNAIEANLSNKYGISLS